MATLIFESLGLLIGGEVIIHILFYFISRWIGKTNKDKISFASVLKGLLERVFIVVTLHFNLASSLTLLGALKIATRIRESEDKVSNDFFLIGNLISVLFAIVYYIILKDFIGI